MGKILYKIEDLPSNYPDLIVGMMKDEGMSKKEVCSELNVTPSAHAKFFKDDEKYKQAFEDGVSFAEAWWMKQARENLSNKSFNVANYAFQMKNRYKWRDTPLVAAGVSKNLSDRFQDKEIIGKYKKTEEVKDEKIIN